MTDEPIIDLHSDAYFMGEALRQAVRAYERSLEIVRHQYENGVAQPVDVAQAQAQLEGTRAQLLDQVWETPEESCDRSVDAHIKMLRAKLKSVMPDQEAIRTHRVHVADLAAHHQREGQRCRADGQRHTRISATGAAAVADARIGATTSARKSSTCSGARPTK